MSASIKKKINVAIVAPGFPPSLEVQKNIKKFIRNHKEFNFYLPPRLIQKNPLFANEESKRAYFLVEALNSDKVDIIWCLRGGYGSLPILKYLKAMPKPKKYKCLVGLSDITSLHLFLNEFWGWSSVHASNLDRWIDGKIPEKILRELCAILNGNKGTTVYKNLKPLNDLAKKLKSVKGVLTGGNLVTLTSHMGTPYEPSFKNQFLFLEEIGERAYRIDRCLTQLALSDALKGCRGILLGQFTSCLEPDGRRLWDWVVKEWAKGIGIPVYSGVPSGHEIEQWPLSFGTQSEVKIINDRWCLLIENRKW